LNISILGAELLEVGAVEVEDGVTAVALELALIELWAEGMMVEAVEKVEFVGFAFEDIEDFKEEAELGGSWSLVIGGVDVRSGLVEALSSPPSYRGIEGVMPPSRAYDLGARG
jgi:hypothetical protein